MWDCKISLEPISADRNDQSENDNSMRQIELEFKLKRRAVSIGQLLLTEDGHAFGPALDRYGENLEFFYSRVKNNEKDDGLQKQSQEISLRDEVYFDKSFLSYKLPEFDNRKLCVTNLMKNRPQMSIPLGACQFVKFVEHSRESAKKLLKLEMR